MKVSVIGTGFGRYAAAPVYDALGFDVEVVSPRDDDAVRRAIAADVDLVSVHSPPFLHREHVLAAVEAGRAVLCDKPFGRNADEAREMRDAATRAGVLHFLNFELRHQPARTQFKRLVADGIVGEPQHLSVSFFGNGLRGRPHSWINDAELGGGWIGAMGAHLIDLTRWLLDSEVDRCGGVARIEEAIRRDADGEPTASTAEDAYSAWFVMANGCTATHDTAFAAPTSLPARIVLLGSERSLELVDDLRLVLRPGRDAAEEAFDFTPPGRAFYEASLTPWFTAVKEAIESGDQLTPSFDDGVVVAETMDALRATMLTTVAE
ncbi:Gfo/Idh/MocA family oxidoreductase [Mycobacterium sp. MYCO198283]|uniref:Gfo/Idh/MocA family protein n=1 Tax=Mycobacterium sp. MYCO198283 TaxID=2883505 RepID=UPI001E508112|nr:Gfo/Idh/MocA family oxidoreductase [Mycobacterium sp. MYCO198283]MCG5431088.1 Gfo/Idh/MocA family oxidoreductase [Mycobacterium sp. MYCO198283]